MKAKEVSLAGLNGFRNLRAFSAENPEVVATALKDLSPQVRKGLEAALKSPDFLTKAVGFSQTPQAERAVNPIHAALKGKPFDRHPAKGQTPSQTQQKEREAGG